MRGVMRLALGALVLLALMPGAAFAQEGQIAGTVRDSSGAVMPGVTVEAASPALIEKVRTATTDDSGQYRITNLPVGTYTVSFALDGFNKQQRNDIILTTGFTAPVNVTLTVGQQAETIIVRGETPTVDVQNARQVTTFSGEDLQELPTSRNITSILALTPGITSSSSQAGGLSGVCVGGAGVFCNPNISDFNSHASGNDTVDGLRQGRIMVDGVPINSGAQGLITGMTAGYVADITNAQEVSIQISGALGESETGGAAINIVPRSGGNRFAGNYNTTSTRQAWFATNNSAYPEVNSSNQLLHYDYAVGASFSGPIQRDRLWFFVQGRDQGKKATPQGGDFFYNAQEGKWGSNYLPDRESGNVTYKNSWRNLQARVTYQATRRDKFQINWDEQDSCQDPCDGVVSVFTSPESWWSVQTKPNRLQQITWTNPFTNRLLFEAGLSITAQHYDTSVHRYIENPRTIPRVTEQGATTSMDLNGVLTNTTAGASAFTALTSGSLNSAIAGGGAELRNNDNYRMRGSASYVTGTHNAKIGYEGAYFSQRIRNEANDPRMTYSFVTPAATCTTTVPTTCGNTSLYFPNDPNNLQRRPRPVSVTINTGVGVLDERAGFAAFYAQDQWTLKRLTLNGAIRYDQSFSNYGETCVGPDRFVVTGYCTPPSDGVSYKDLTPRWSAAWDLFGTGKTSLKFNMGKFLGAAGLNGTYTGANPARRTVNSVTMNWDDTDGDRVVDCNLLNIANGAFVPNGECTAAAFQDYLRFGRDPLGLDEAGTPIGLANTQCGREEAGIPAAVQAYCAQYGDSLISGWGVRRYEWQTGIGVQHELLPRLSVEVTYNRRKYGNQTVTDQLNIGCDRYNGAVDVKTCQDGYLNYSSPQYDFLSVTAPTDPRLPNGGGYVVRGAANPKAALPTGQPQAQTLMQELEYSWSGVDTNFTWRAPGGLRVNGGTSTGRAKRDTCYSELDGPTVKGREGNLAGGGCRPYRPFQTRMNGSAAYTIPKVDVLVSTVFQLQPGVERAMNITYNKDQVVWDPASASRATNTALCTGANAGQTGCFVVSGGATSQTTYLLNVLDFGDLYGERIWNVDLKLAKNIRMGSKRFNVGADIYDIFNNDSVDQYNDTWTIDNPATPAVEVNNWGNATRILSPRFVRLSVQFYF